MLSAALHSAVSKHEQTGCEFAECVLLLLCDQRYLLELAAQAVRVLINAYYGCLHVSLASDVRRFLQGLVMPGFGQPAQMGNGPAFPVPAMDMPMPPGMTELQRPDFQVTPPLPAR